MQAWPSDDDDDAPLSPAPAVPDDWRVDGSVSSATWMSSASASASLASLGASASLAASMEPPPPYSSPSSRPRGSDRASADRSATAREEYDEEPDWGLPRASTRASADRSATTREEYAEEPDWDLARASTERPRASADRSATTREEYAEEPDWDLPRASTDRASADRSAMTREEYDEEPYWDLPRASTERPRASADRGATTREEYDEEPDWDLPRASTERPRASADRGATTREEYDEEPDWDLPRDATERPADRGATEEEERPEPTTQEAERSTPRQARQARLARQARQARQAPQARHPAQDHQAGQQSQQPRQRKDDARRVSAWLAQSRQLASRVAVLERERAQSFFHSRTLAQQGAADLEAGELADSRARDGDARRLAGQLRRLKQSADKARRGVAAMGAGRAYAARLETLLTDTESQLAAFREAQMRDYDRLLAQERALTRDLELDQRRFDEWPAPGQRRRAASAPRARVASAQPQRPPAAAGDGAMEDRVADVNARIDAHGGSSGGWHPADHDAFCRHWVRINGGPGGCEADKHSVRSGKMQALVKACQGSVPGVSGADVREHYAWYVGYLELLAEKKRLVAAWRARQAEAPARSEEELAAERREAQRKAARERARAKVEAEEREAKRAAVQEWRRRKSSQAAAAAAESAATSDAQRERERARREEARRERDKERVRQFQRERRLREEREAAAKRLLERAQSVAAKPDAKEAEARRQRDMAIARRRRQAREQQQQEEAAPVRRRLRRAPPDAVAEAKRDPQRLLRPTKAFMLAAISGDQVDEMAERRKTTSAHDSVVASSAGAGNSKYKSYDRPVQRRAVPAWRRGL